MFSLLICAVSDSLGQSLRKPFKGKSVIFYSALICSVACLVFLIYAKFQLAFNTSVYVHGLISAVLMTITNIFLTKALQTGSLSLSSLIISLSLLIPTFYGILFLDNQPSLFFYFGLAVLVVAILFLNLESKDKNSEENKEKKKISIAWIIFIALAFLGNGFSSAVVANFSKGLRTDIENQIISNEAGAQYQSAIMILVFGISSIICFIVSFLTERKTIKSDVKSAVTWGLPCGLCVGLVNLFVIIAQMSLDASVVFTVISGASMTLTFITALLVFKEKYRKMQYVGFAFGLVSLILLNL